VYVTVACAVVEPPIAVTKFDEPAPVVLTNVWTPVVAPLMPVGNPTRSQPFWKDPVGTFATFTEPRRPLLLKVTTFASQHREFVRVGGGGEKLTGVLVVLYSRSKMLSETSSHAPAVVLKLRWNSFGALPVPGTT
jgi:hypothetical protein